MSGGLFRPALFDSTRRCPGYPRPANTLKDPEPVQFSDPLNEDGAQRSTFDSMEQRVPPSSAAVLLLPSGHLPFQRKGATGKL